jgi:plastocyanin domain-containing protein
VTAEREVQVVQAKYHPDTGVQPTELTVKVNQPVRVEVFAEADGECCMGSFTIPAFSQRSTNFKKGETVVIEFTPTKTGTYQMTCAMGVPHGTLKVI